MRYYRVIGLLLLFITSLPIILLLLSNKTHTRIKNNDDVGDYLHLLDDEVRKIKPKKCVIQKLEPFGSNMMKHFVKVKPYICSNIKSWIMEKDGKLQLTSENKNIECNIKFFDRKTDTQNKFLSSESLVFNNTITLESDFLKVNCKNSQTQQTYDNIEAKIKKLKVDKKTNRKCRTGSGSGLNVIIIGFDSLSHMTYIRMLNKTYRYFVDTLKGKMLYHYNIVGDGTGHALTPILTGTEEEQLPSALKTKPNTVHVNKWPFVWNRYKEEGYITMYNEDQPPIGTYTFRLNGFKEQPTDHYMRTFYIDALKEFSKHKPYCLGSKRRTQVFFDYFKDFQTKYAFECTFSFLFHSEVSHENNSQVSTADDDIYETLKFLNDNGHLNRSVLFLMSDHGARFSSIRKTLQGKLEERLPFFGVLFPKWFELKYPHLARNLEDNTQRLLTPFDIHATLEDILYMDQSKFTPVNKYGISILRQIPENRTCEDAHVGTHWCTCSNILEIKQNSSIAKSMASALIFEIRNHLKNHMDICSNLTLASIVSVTMLEPEKDLVNFKQSIKHDVYDMSAKTVKDVNTFQITIETQPGNGLFESSFTQLSSGKLKIQNEISRINKYGKAALCVSEKFPDIRKFCYCKNSEV